MVELPSGTVTFLFTDIEGSTRMWEEHPDAMRPVLARHDELVRTAIVTHGGHYVKTTGDGAHAVFATAADAVDAAVAFQVALAAEDWPLPDPMRVRAGIHTGPAELRDGDYYGTTVNKSARIMSVAHGGQVVLSAATHELTRDAPITFETVDLGEHRLKDLGEPERIFQVLHPDLERDFPPLRSLDMLPGNLPAQVTSFVGRDDDIAQIVAMLADGAALVTLIGNGGVGKTRLAVQVAAEVLPRFADGAWFCDLASARDGDAMAQVVATALGCMQRPGMSLGDSVVEYAKVRELLVVLDNCEHLLDEASELAEAMMRACPRGQILATSREAFGVPGERVVRVRSLAAPDPSVVGEALLESAAVRLFVDRATDAGADAVWNDAQWSAVAEICRRIDGIPLAIELAAARAASMRPAEIAAHLDERFRLLTGTKRGRVERQQTLRATVEWSYQLLEPDERAVFDRLGVFAGSFDVTGASAVVSDDDLDGWRIVDSIASLVAKSMLVVEDGPDDTARYTMLETLRQFARERVEETGDADRWRRRHAEHYVTFAEAVGTGLKGRDEAVWTARLVSELDNLRAAVGWGLDRRDPDERELAVRIVASFSFTTMRLATINALALQVAPAARQSRPALRAPVLGLAAYYEMHQGNVERARALADEALRDGIVPDATNPYMAYQALTFIEMAVGNAPQALEISRVVLRDGLERSIDAWSRAQHLTSVATYEAMLGQLVQARADVEEALDAARRLGNPGLLADAYHAMTWAYQRDDPETALEAAVHWMDLYRTGIAKGGSAAGMFSMWGGLRFRTGDPHGALELLRVAVELTRDLGARPQLTAALDWSLGPLVKTGRPEPAATLVGALTRGSLADVGNWPLSAATRTRTLERVTAALGEAATGRLVAAGAAMAYDDIIQYALDELGGSVS